MSSQKTTEKKKKNTADGRMYETLNYIPAIIQSYLKNVPPLS